VGLALKKNIGFYKKDEDIFYEMLFADTLRGNDSTGAIYIERDGSFGYAKDMHSAPLVIGDFKNVTVAKTMLQEGKAVIGHNRKATVGKVQKDTAHPFIVDKTFALVHNGTLYGHKLLADTDVDSEALAIHMKKALGPDYTKEKFEEAIGEVSGAYAVACFNQETNKIHLFRNNQRPLYIVETDDTWYWASEYGMLSWILSRNGVAIKKDMAEIVKDNCLYTIDLTDSKITKEDYVPKKATPVPTMVVGTGTIKLGMTSLSDDLLSKNEFKRLKANLQFKTLEFWADDFVERNFPRSVVDGETELTLFGELNDGTYKFKHIVQGFIDLKYHPSLHPGGILNKLYAGRIFDMEYCKRTKQVALKMDRLATVTSSLIALPKPSSKDDVATGVVIDGKWIQDRLEQDETSPTVHNLH
jgi:hypothetical protein